MDGDNCDRELDLSEASVAHDQAAMEHILRDDEESPATGDLAAEWARVQARLRLEVGESEYRSWLREMTVAGVDGDEARVHLPTRFMRDWVRSHYGDRLKALWQAENPLVRWVDIRVGPAGPQADGLTESLAQPPADIRLDPPGSGRSAAMARPDAAARPLSDEAAERVGDIAAPLERRYSFDSFVVGKPNEFAHACARRVSSQPASQGFNPLFLYGGVGLGKTHLMHAIAWELLATRGGAEQFSVAYMSAEKFMWRFIAALRSQSTMAFKEQLRGVDVLMVDDLQFLIGKDSTQEEFFHTFNALIDGGRQIVVSADKSPSDLSGLEERMRTRLGCGMVADLHATTYELRILILEDKAERAKVTVPRKVMEFLAHKITSNVRELEGALNRLIAHANLFNRPVTLDTAQEVLHDLLRAQERHITIEEIQRKVAEHFTIRLTDMSSARRARAVARPRQVAMYLAKQLTKRSLPEIGRKFGNRDHTTVMHAVSRIGELMEKDAGFAEDVRLLRSMLES